MYILSRVESNYVMIFLQKSFVSYENDCIGCTTLTHFHEVIKFSVGFSHILAISYCIALEVVVYPNLTTPDKDSEKVYKGNIVTGENKDVKNPIETFDPIDKRDE